MPTAATAAGSRLSSPDSDRDLVAQLLSGDEQAFADVVRRYHGPLLRFARIFVATPDVAEEVVQDGWLAVVTGLPAFEGRSSLKSWIFGIVANKAKTRGVRERRTIPFADLMTTDEDGAAVDGDRFRRDGGWRQPPARWDGNTPEAQLLRREAISIVERVLAELPPAQRAVVTLRDVEDLDAAETCNMLGITETNQRVLLHRGRSKIRAAIEGSAAKGR